MTKREKGVETRECPSCGAELAVATQDDGGTTVVRCDNCHPEAQPETAAAVEPAPAPKREKGTPAPDQTPEA